MERELVCYVNEGGKKTHVGYYEDGRPLCGRIHPQYGCTFPNIDEEWINAGIDSDEICLDCAKKTRLILKSDSKRGRRNMKTLDS